MENNTPRVLVIEDERNIWDTLKRMLNKLGIEQVEFVDTAADACVLLQNDSFDWAFVDLNLKDGERAGLKVLDYIHNHKIKTKSIIMSGSIDLKEECVNKGAVRFIDKPFIRSEFMEEVSRLLELKNI